RTAAELCSESDNFIFNHNEAILYKWVEEYEPSLFRKIQKLVRQGKWHIMGGWYLQPDCNMPSGETFVRHIVAGKNYFREKFGVDAKTAINFDSFGHSRGIVQIMAKCGYDSYLFCRPSQNDCQLPDDIFVWKGFNNTSLLCRRMSGGYGSHLGKAVEKIKGVVEKEPGKKTDMILWGIGNHGGGPSRKDISDIEKFIREKSDETEIIHSTPEDYFSDLKKQKKGNIPTFSKDLNPWAVGCYTSMIRIKQKFRLLENELYMTEKMASSAYFQKLHDYPGTELSEARNDLLTASFHDILPGSSIQPVEEMAVRLMDHALENISRVKTRAFFALASGQEKPPKDEIPVLVYNPHPFRTGAVIDCEFMLPDQNWSDENKFTDVEVYSDGRKIPAQVEKEASNLSLDWRKKIVFRAELTESGMNRFNCRLNLKRDRPVADIRDLDGIFKFKNDVMEIGISRKTGLIEYYSVKGVNHISSGAFKPTVIVDNEDPWGMKVRRFDEIEGVFRLISPSECARFCGVQNKTLVPVRIIEDGEVRTIVESVFSFGSSRICQQYIIPKTGTEFEVMTRVFWNEKDRFLKLNVPVSIRCAEFLGQTAFGYHALPSNGDETVSQKWLAINSETDSLTCINDGTYASSFENGNLRLSLLRSPAYSGHPIGNRPIVPQDRFTPRIDQGERLFRFWFNAGPLKERMKSVDRESLMKNEKPVTLSFFPPGSGNKLKEFCKISGNTVQLVSARKAEKGDALIVRLFEAAGIKAEIMLEFPFAGFKRKLKLSPFEFKTFRFDPKRKLLSEIDASGE
ncbi:MAG: glycoside hydrolase family 38 C-terminal domain-containing protein, partial [Victivallales bacterium]